MNNTEKLLRAFIQASGYEVESKLTKEYGHIISVGGLSGRMQTGKEYEFFPATSGMPSAEYREVIRGIDHKVTKRESKELINAMDKVIDKLYAEFSYVDPDILAAFKKAGWESNE